MHRAWIVAASAFVALLAAAAIRATFGILMEPLMDEFGWSHGAISTAASLNLVVFGISAPFAAALNERFGLRRVVTVALGLIVVAAAVLALAAVRAGLRDSPEDVGTTPYGGLAEPIAAGARPAAVAVLRQIYRDRVFVALAGSFFICGATTVGLIAVHLIPAAHD